MRTELDKMIAESKYLSADCDRLVAEANLLILQADAREARCKTAEKFTLHKALIWFAIFCINIMLMTCNMVLLDFDDN